MNKDENLFTVWIKNLSGNCAGKPGVEVGKTISIKTSGQKVGWLNLSLYRTPSEEAEPHCLESDSKC